MKPERVDLLLTLLRLKSVSIERLKKATAKCSSNLQVEKIPVLEEIHHVVELERLHQQKSLGKYKI